MASVGRALGMSAVECADLATCAILHSWYAYPNPDLENIPSEATVASPLFRQVVEGSKYTPAWRRASRRHSIASCCGSGASWCAWTRPSPWGQLIALIRFYLKQVRGGEQGMARSPLTVGRIVELPARRGRPHVNQCLCGDGGLIPVGTLVELMNGDLAVVSDIEHLRGRHLYSSRPAPLTKPLDLCGTCETVPRQSF